MKILVLNGSPRPNGNTAGMVKTFQQAAVEHGHQVKVFNVCKMNINGWFYKNRREKTGGRHNRVSYPIEKRSLKSGQY